MKKFYKAVLSSNVFSVVVSLPLMMIGGVVLPLYPLVLLIIVSVVVVVGGYYAAQTAQEKPLLVGTMSSILNVFCGLLFGIPVEGSEVLVLPFLGMLGGLIYHKYPR